MIAKRDQTERRRWDISAELRAEIVTRLMSIVTGDNPAQRIRAARLLMELDSLNITASAMAQELEAEMKSQILKVLRQRGEG